MAYKRDAGRSTPYTSHWNRPASISWRGCALRSFCCCSKGQQRLGAPAEWQDCLGCECLSAVPSLFCFPIEHHEISQPCSPASVLSTTLKPRPASNDTAPSHKRVPCRRRSCRRCWCRCSSPGEQGCPSCLTPAARVGPWQLHSLPTTPTAGVCCSCLLQHSDGLHC